MSKDHLEDLYATFERVQQHLTNSGIGNECSSGGTDRTEVRQAGDNIITRSIERACWLEEAISDVMGDASKANYKTLVRRISQNLRTKEDFKESVLQAQTKEQVISIVDAFANNRVAVMTSEVG